MTSTVIQNSSLDNENLNPFQTKLKQNFSELSTASPKRNAPTPDSISDYSSTKLAEEDLDVNSNPKVPAPTQEAAKAVVTTKGQDNESFSLVRAPPTQPKKPRTKAKAKAKSSAISWREPVAENYIVAVAPLPEPQPQPIKEKRKAVAGDENGNVPPASKSKPKAKKFKTKSQSQGQGEKPKPKSQGQGENSKPKSQDQDDSESLPVTKKKTSSKGEKKVKSQSQQPQPPPTQQKRKADSAQPFSDKPVRTKSRSRSSGSSISEQGSKGKGKAPVCPRNMRAVIPAEKDRRDSKSLPKAKAKSESDSKISPWTPLKAPEATLSDFLGNLKERGRPPSFPDLAVCNVHPLTPEWDQYWKDFYSKLGTYKDRMQEYERSMFQFSRDFQDYHRRHRREQLDELAFQAQIGLKPGDKKAPIVRAPLTLPLTLVGSYVIRRTVVTPKVRSPLVTSLTSYDHKSFRLELELVDESGKYKGLLENKSYFVGVDKTYNLIRVKVHLKGDEGSHQDQGQLQSSQPLPEYREEIQVALSPEKQVLRDIHLLEEKLGKRLVLIGN